MDEIRIPNDATYAPFSLTDVIATAPLASRLVLGVTLPGRVLSAAALGMYAGSAVKDWVSRRDMRWIDFSKEFGCDVKTLQPMPLICILALGIARGRSIQVCFPSWLLVSE